MTSSSPKASIVVACRNEAPHIRALLDSIIQQKLAGISWEAIIADGMSTDGTRAIVEAYARHYPQIRMIDNPENIVSTGLNRAIRAASGTIILRMDAHTSYSPDYCRRCLELLETTNAENVGGPARTRAASVRARAIAAAYHSRFSTGGARFHDPSFSGWVDTVPYGCWRKATLERLGLFDESLVRNQDDELNLRLLRQGGKVWQDASIVSWYSPRASLTRLFRQYFQYGYWKVAIIRKHRLAASWRHLVPAAFILANAGLMVATAIAALVGGYAWLTGSLSLWAALLLTYVAANLAASAITAAHAGWTTLPYLPAVFAIYHLSYGLGFCCGLRWILCAPVASSRESVFTSLSR